MHAHIKLVDINPVVVHAWREVFADEPDVEIVEGSILQQPVCAWVTPTNAAGRMNGGLDLVIKRHLGKEIEKRVQQEITDVYDGFLPVGYAVCIPTGLRVPRYLISTPTMAATQENISETLNVALACAAALQAAELQNKGQPDSIRSLAMPGLGAATGRVPADLCAGLMRAALNLFRDDSFDDFEAMHAALQYEMEELAFLLGIGPTYRWN